MVDINSPSPSYPLLSSHTQEPSVLHQPRDGGGGGGGEGAGRVRLHSHCAGTGSSQYSLWIHYRVFTNVQATDSAGASSQTQLDVAVRPGPNIRPPFFTKLVYTAKVRCSCNTTHCLFVDIIEFNEHKS